MIETVLNIFFVEKNLFDIYDKTYNRNNPKRAEGRDVGVPRKHKDKED